MKITRRVFLGGSFAAVSTIALKGAKTARASVQPFAGIIYTKENPGKWKEKVGSHAPQISVEGRQVTITTPHPMSQGHFIVRHTLILKDGSVAGEKTFFPVKDTKPVSTFELPEGYKSSFYATSFCNLHDLWVTEGSS
jgi:superoxide reductase